MDTTILTIFAGGVLLCAVPVALVVDAAVSKHVRLQRERAKADFERRQAAARAELSAYVAGATTALKACNEELEKTLPTPRKPTAREPETKPTATPRPAAKRRSPPPAAKVWPVTHGSHRTVEETGFTPLAVWDAPSPPPPPPPAPSYDSGVTASGSWGDSSSSSSSSDSGSGSSGCDASGSW